MTTQPDGILHMPERQTHTCKPPAITTWSDLREGGVPKYERLLPEGTVWQCPACGRVKVVCWQPDRTCGYVHIAGGWEWRPERRGERRRRLGLRWWQKETKR